LGLKKTVNERSLRRRVRSSATPQAAPPVTSTPREFAANWALAFGYARRASSGVMSSTTLIEITGDGGDGS
jgi:hypothetical protein